MRRCALVLLLLALALPGFAEEEQHHEDLTADQLGKVHFPVSCNAAAQEPFTRGVALLHSFWYEEAEKAFQETAKADPQCAMAHWGLAMSLWHELWNHPDDATIEHGRREAEEAERLHAKTQRERDYVAAVKSFYSGSPKLDYKARSEAYSQAMAKVYERYPEDHEGAAFYALSLLALEPGKNKEAAAILEKLFATDPNHPGVAHYLIHSYDTPEMAALGLPAARRYAKIAPAAPHALHMPSHIFARLGLWQDDIDSNLASIAASHHSAEMHMGGESHEFHAMDFLAYAYLQTGQESKVQKMIAEVKAMPPIMDMYGDNMDPRATALVSYEAIGALDLHHWAEAAALQPVPGATLGDNAITHWARAIGAAHEGHSDQVRAELAQIEAIKQQLTEQKKPQFMIDAVEQDRQEVLAWIDHLEGNDEEAAKRLQPIAEKEGGFVSVGGGIPAYEMLGDMLLEKHRAAEALAEYEKDLKDSPYRFNGLYGAAQAAEVLGKNDVAREYYAQLVKQCAGSNSGRPELARAKAAAEQAAIQGK
jgi:tetratricopeptide (TPR) repeat protein